MKLKEMALIAEIFTAAAVVVSLIFVGLEVRHAAIETSLNTRAIEASAFQDLTNQVNSISALVMANPQLAELKARGVPESPQEEQQLTSLHFMVFRHGELVFLQFEKGLIDEESMRSMMGPVRLILRTDAFAVEVWNRSSAAFVTRYQDLVNTFVTYTAPN